MQQLEQVVMDNEPMHLFVSVQVDPKLNPGVSVAVAVRDALVHIKATLSNIGVLNVSDLLVKHSSPASDSTIHDVHFPEVFVRSNADRKRFLELVYNSMAAGVSEQRQEVLRVRRCDNGVVQECWTILLDRDALSMRADTAVPEELVHSVPGDAVFVAVPPRDQGSRQRHHSVSDELVAAADYPYRKLDHAISLLQSVLKRHGAKAMSIIPMMEKRENPLMPRAVRIVLDSHVCAAKGKDHKMACSFVDVFGEEGYANACCEVCGCRRIELPRDDKCVFQFLQRFWSRDRWLTALNATYCQLGNGNVMEKLVNEYGTVSMVSRKEGELKAFFKGHKYISWETVKKGKKELKQTVFKDITFWLESLDRAHVKDYAFNPQREPGRKGDYLNLYEGLAVKPQAPASGKLEDAAPLLRQHILEVVCGGDEAAYEYVLNCNAKLVKYPWLKLGVVITLKGKQGAGKNAYLDVLRSIFGRHGIEVTNQRHATGNFNQHMRNKLLIVLNEAVWGGDKQSEGALKASITETYCLFEGKGENVRESQNHWSYMISSNENWCIPASSDARRFYMPPMSNHRVGDHDYFKALFGALDKEVPEFLWYLMQRPVDKNWNAQENMPPRTAEFYEQYRQDRHHAREVFLVDQLKEEGEWIYRAPAPDVMVIPIIQRGKPTLVHGDYVLEALKQASTHNAPLRSLIPSLASVATFFKKVLGPQCFTNRGRASAALPRPPYEPIDVSVDKRFYRFESAETIKQHLTTDLLQISGFFDEEERPLRKRRATAAAAAVPGGTDKDKVDDILILDDDDGADSE